MAGHAVQLGKQHANPHRTVGDVAVDAKEFLGGHRKDQLVIERAQVVHAGDVRAALHKGELLGGLLHARVQVADNWLAAKHGFALEFKHETEHAVGGRMLGPHVDDHRLIFFGVVRKLTQIGCIGLGHAQNRADFAQQLARRCLAARLELLIAFVCACNEQVIVRAEIVGPGRRRVESGRLGVPTSEFLFGGAHALAPLNCTGMRPIS